MTCWWAFRHLYLSEGGQFAEITLAFCFRVVEFRWGSGHGGTGAISLIPQQSSILQIHLKMSLHGSMYIAASKPLISTHSYLRLLYNDSCDTRTTNIYPVLHYCSGRCLDLSREGKLYICL